MTTLIGIKAGKGKKGVILASDLTGTREAWTPKGDVAYRQQNQKESQKIYVNRDRTAAVAVAGLYDNEYRDFLYRFQKGDVDLEKALKEGFFSEFANLNLSRWGGAMPDDSRVNDLLLSSRLNGQPRLYRCLPLGKVVEIPDVAVIGSGTGYAQTYIGEQTSNRNIAIPRGVSIRNGVDLAASAIVDASQDIYTEGLNIAVTHSGGIDEYGEMIKKEMDSARRNALKNIKRKY